MAFGKKKPAQTAAGPSAANVVPRPPMWFWVVKYSLFASIIAINIGMWAIIDQHLTLFPFTYNGPDPQYNGKTANIAYCLLSNTKGYMEGGSMEGRCNFAIAAPSISFVLAIIWVMIQGVRNERDNSNYKLLLWADAGICLLGAGWWILSGVLISIWTSQANASGLPGSNWRNGLSAMAWICWLLYALLLFTSVIFMSRRAQRKAFTPTPKAPKPAKDVESGTAAPSAAAAAAPVAAGGIEAAPVAGTSLGAGHPTGGAWGGGAAPPPPPPPAAPSATV